ncbi:MAG: FAD-dependent oxidoreductase, partial [Planctomycetia bacterium]
AILGGWQRRDVLQWTDRELVEAVRADLAAALGVAASPIFQWIYRWPLAIPQYFLGHGARLERIDTAVRRHDGLFLTGNAYRGVAINDCTAEAERTATAVRRHLAEV